MADFITLVVAYMVLFLLLSYILLCGDSSFHRHGVIGKLRSAFVQIAAFLIYACFPRKVQTFVGSIISYLFYKRNHYIQALYVVIFVGVLWVFTTQVHPKIKALHLSAAHQITPYIVMATNLAVFITCCLSDPGVITKENYSSYANVFKYDGILYKAGLKCRTCNFVKPARSKHCAFCNHCVYRFDHHCSWVNNCIGGRNARYFILLLVTITLTTFYLSYITGRVLQGVADQSGIWQAGYIGTDELFHRVNARIVFQHMFMQLPAMVVLMTSLSLLGILMTAFLSYHLFLLLSNQTTNERYKRSRVTLEVGRSQRSTTSNKGKTRKGNVEKGEQSHFQNQNRDCPSDRWSYYDRGFRVNLWEVISPSL